MGSGARVCGSTTLKLGLGYGEGVSNLLPGNDARVLLQIGAATTGGSYNWLRLQLHEGGSIGSAAATPVCCYNWLRLQLVTGVAVPGWGCTWLGLHLAKAATGCGYNWLRLQLVAAATICRASTEGWLQLDVATSGAAAIGCVYVWHN